MVRVIVEAISPVYTCCDAHITAQDVASASRFQNERRRCEHLAWRRVVRRELGREVAIDYNEVGAPVVDIPNIYISVSHCADMVAVAIADCRVGIDIEQCDRNFERVKSRYMTSEEEALADHDMWCGEVWCAKESMYKYYGVQGVDLCRDLRVESYDAASQTMIGCMTDRESVRVEMLHYGDNWIVATAVLNE